MARYTRLKNEVKSIFVGIDLHLNAWYVTICTDDQEVYHGSIPGTWEALRRLLDRYRGRPVQACYEAGYFGFWLHDRLVDYGVRSAS